MKPAKALVITAALLALVIAALFVDFDGPQSAPLTGEATGADDSGTRRDSELEASPETDSPAEARAAITSEAPLAIEPSSTELSISGTVVLEGADGFEQLNASGRMYLSFSFDRGTRFVSVPIIGGTWTARFEQLPDGDYTESNGTHPDHKTHFAGGFPDSLITATQVELDSALHAIPPPHPERFMFGDEDAVIQLYLITPAFLIVEDAKTGAALDQVTIVGDSSDIKSGPTNPTGGSHAVLVRDGVSPIELDPFAFPRDRDHIQCLIGSPGYAWAKITIAPNASESQRVKLVPGGDLELKFVGAPSTGVLVATLYTGDSQRPLITHLVDTTNGVLITGLEQREYNLRVKRQSNWASSFKPPLGGVLARQKVQVTAGETKRVTLDLSLSDQPPEALVSGELILPAAWQLKEFSVQFEPIDGTAAYTQEEEDLFELFDHHLPPTPPVSKTSANLLLDQTAFEKTPGLPDTYQFDLGLVLTGTYKMTLLELNQSIFFDVGRDGRSDIRLVIPEPVWIDAHVRDSISGQSVNVAVIQWASKIPNTISDWEEWQLVKPAQPDSHFRLRVPKTTVHILARASQQFSNAIVTVQAKDGLAVELSVQPACRIVLTFQCDGITVENPYERNAFKTMRLDGPVIPPRRFLKRSNLFGQHLDQEKSSLEILGEILLPSPGRYRLSFGEPLGFKNPAPMRVDVAPGETTQVTVELERVPVTPEAKD